MVSEDMDLSQDSTSSSLNNSTKSPSSLPVFYNPNAIMGQTYLTKENYVNWSTLFKTLLRTHKLLFIIDPNQPVAKLDDGSDNPQHELWVSGTDLVCGWIKGTVTPAVQPYLNSCDTAPKAWAVLAKRFGATSALQIENLKEKLHDLKKESDTPIADYLLRASSLSDALTAAGAPIDDSELVQRILGGLGHEFKEFLTSTAAIHARQPLSFDDMSDLLLKEEMLQKKFSVPVQQSVALVGEKQPPSNSRGGQNNGEQRGRRKQR